MYVRRPRTSTPRACGGCHRRLLERHLPPDADARGVLISGRPGESSKSDDYTLKLADRVERRQWSNEVLAALKTEMGQLASTTFEIHAGIEYRAFGLEQALWPVF